MRWSQTATDLAFFCLPAKRRQSLTSQTIQVYMSVSGRPCVAVRAVRMALTAGQGGALVLCVLGVIFSRDLYGLMQGSTEVRSMASSSCTSLARCTPVDPTCPQCIRPHVCDAFLRRTRRRRRSVRLQRRHLRQPWTRRVSAVACMCPSAQAEATGAWHSPLHCKSMLPRVLVVQRLLSSKLLASLARPHARQPVPCHAHAHSWA